MNQFDDKYLKINGHNLFDEFGFKSFTIKASSDRKFGISRSIEMEESYKTNENFVKLKNNRPTYDIEISKVDEYNNALKITDNMMDSIAMLLFEKDICELEVDGRCYYGTFVDGEEWRNRSKRGYICLKFELIDPYCYTREYTNEKKIVGEKTIDLQNNSTVDNYNYVDIVLTQLGTGNIVFKNINTDEVITIKNVATNEKIKIISDTKEIFSITNPDKNMFPNIEYDKEFLRIRYGRNRIKVTGNCLCEFRYKTRYFIR